MSDLQVLYYPTMHLRDPSWIRSQLLYFDKIHTIFPGDRPSEEESREEAELRDRRILIRENPLDFPRAIDRASRGMMLLFQSARRGRVGSHFPDHPIYRKSDHQLRTWLSKLGSAEGGAALNQLIPNDNALLRELRDTIGDVGRLDPVKMSIVLQDYIEERTENDVSVNAYADCDRWLYVDSTFVGIYMTILAQEMARERRWGAVTDTPVLDALFQEIFATRNYSAGNRPLREREAVLVDVVLDAIRIKADVSLDTVLRVRDEHYDELLSLREKIFELAGGCVEGANSRELRESAEAAYKRNVEPKLKTLRKSMSSVIVDSGRSEKIKIALSAANVAVAGWALNAGDVTAATIGALTVAVVALPADLYSSSLFSRERSPYSYLLTLQNKLK